MCGLLTPDSGSGTCLGYDIVRDSAQIKRRVGYMTQRFSYWEDLSIRENLDFVARVYGMPDRKAASRAHSTAGLASRADQLTGALSGGWKQRLALAACMLHGRAIAARRTDGRRRSGRAPRLLGRTAPAGRAGSRCSSARTTWTRPSAATSWRTSHTATARAGHVRGDRRVAGRDPRDHRCASERTVRAAAHDAGRRPDGRVRLGAARERPRSRPARRDARAGRGTAGGPRCRSHRSTPVEDVFIYMMGRASGPPGGASS